MNTSSPILKRKRDDEKQSDNIDVMILPESSYFLIQLSADDDGNEACSYLVPTAFFNDEIRRPGAKKAFELLCQHCENIHIIQDFVYQLIIDAFFDIEHETEDENKTKFMETFGKPFDVRDYSWKAFILKHNKIDFQEKLRDARTWVENYFGTEARLNEEYFTMLSAPGTTITAFYFIQQ